ncbi:MULTISPECIES: DICT sensory domain-containing protein [Nocardiaceae]|uniref:DICT sensory domain-containing protein n=1 Tax=Nocardiaceae TaxID=85025 RepID=UPI00039FA0BF|nr:MULTISPECIES: DICT sensory domain-containing protein [Rhodococcus]
MSSPRFAPGDVIPVELDPGHTTSRSTGVLADAVVIDHVAFSRNPASVLSTVESARAQARPVALDGVGTGPESLALLPLIEPDVIILAPEMTGSATDVAAARALHVLAAQAERTGAVVVARGVDSDRDRDRALALGATFGLGDLFRADGGDVRPDAVTPPTWNTPSSDHTSAFVIASTDQTTTVSTKKLLVQMSMHIEAQASDAGPDTLVLGTFQHSRHFTARTRRRWRTLAGRTAYTGVYGIGLGELAVPGIVGSSLDASDDLVDEWNVVVLGQFFCCVLSARDLHRGEDDPDREFEYAITHDRATVVRCARTVLSRSEPR